MWFVLLACSGEGTVLRAASIRMLGKQSRRIVGTVEVQSRRISAIKVDSNGSTVLEKTLPGFTWRRTRRGKSPPCLRAGRC